MNSSLNSRVALMDAGYKAYFYATTAMKKHLAEGIFWLVDNIEQEIKKQKYPLQGKCLAELREIKNIAEDSFKDPSKWAGTEEFANLCAKVPNSFPN
jgi:hypothetical protein